MTHLESVWTMALSWVLVPAVVTLVAAGVGLGMARLAGVRLGALTLPTGFLTGIAVISSLLLLKLSAIVVLTVTVALAVAGAAASLLWRQPNGERRLLRADGRWAVAAGAVTFLIGMAPLIGSGHVGILGYVLNNDSAVHTTSIELLLQHGARSFTPDSSYTQVTQQFHSGYPIGSYAWPVLAGVLTGADAFLTWSPMLAVAAAMTALSAFAILRRLGAGGAVAAAGGIVVACGYLPFSFLATASPKETILGGGLLTVVALVLLAIEGGVRARRAVLPGATLAAAVAVFSIGAVAPLGPPVAVGALIGLVRARGRRLRALGALVAGAVVAFVLAAPNVFASLTFASTSERLRNDPNAIGNLLGAVPWQESFNAWLAGDYRFAHSPFQTLATAGTVFAALLAALGIVAALRRRLWAVPLIVLGAAIGAKWVESRYAIYFAAKLYVVLGVALGLATMAGLVAIIRHPRTRRLGLALGVVWVLVVAASDVAVYRQVWTTPVGRFQELAQIDKRFAGQGPILVNQREDYAKEILRDVKPWDSWDVWTPDNGLRIGYPPPPPHAPDLDDYRWNFIRRFPLLLDPRRPGGSLPPHGYTLVAQTPHYRVWRRTGTVAEDHLALGSEVIAGTAALDCSAPGVRAFMTAARGQPLRVALGRATLPALPAWRFDFLPPAEGGPTADAVYRRGGVGFTSATLPAGRWVAWIQGQFGPGLRLVIDGRTVGEVRDDLGVYDNWHRLGPVTIPRGGAHPRLVGLHRPPWEAGMRRLDLTGTLALTPAGRYQRVVTVPASRQRSLCGRNLDWVERG